MPDLPCPKTYPLPLPQALQSPGSPFSGRLPFSPTPAQGSFPDLTLTPSFPLEPTTPDPLCPQEQVLCWTWGVGPHTPPGRISSPQTRPLAKRVYLLSPQSTVFSQAPHLCSCPLLSAWKQISPRKYLTGLLGCSPSPSTFLDPKEPPPGATLARWPEHSLSHKAARGRERESGSNFGPPPVSGAQHLRL